MSERIFSSFERMYLRLRTYFDRYTQLCPRYKNKQSYSCKTKLCINIHNSAKSGCGKLGGKCGKAHGIVEKAKRFTRYRLYMERQYTLRIHFYDMLRAGTLKSSIKWIGNVISAYTNKRRVFSDKTKGPPKQAFKSTEYLKVMPQPFLFYCGGRESLRRRSQRKRGIRRLLRHRTLCRRWCQTERRRAGCRECRRFAPRK